MPERSGTHLLWGVEQVYSSGDFKKRVFVKYRLRVSNSLAIGGWTKIAKGQVLHLRDGNRVTAYYAEGLDNREIQLLDRQLRPSRVSRTLDFILPSAHAETTVDSEAAACGTACGVPDANAPPLERIRNVSVCVGQQTIESALAGAKTILDNASWEGARAAATNTIVGAWDGLGKAWNGAGGAITGAGEMIKTTFTDPGKAWSDVSGSFDQSLKTMGQLAVMAEESVENFSKLSPEIQDEILCHFLSEMAGEGILSVAMAVTGAGASLAIAKITMAVTRYALKIKPIMDAIKAVSELKDLAMDKKRELVRKYLHGESPQMNIAEVANSAPVNVPPAMTPEMDAATRLASTNQRLLAADMLKKTSLRLATRCDTCPKNLFFSRADSHFDNHILERRPGGVPTNAAQSLMKTGDLSHLTEADLKELRMLARKQNNTSFWSAETRNSVVDHIEDIPLTPLSNELTNGTRTFTGSHNGMSFKVIVCENPPCGYGKNFGRGEVTSIYPTCGNGIIELGTKNDFLSCPLSDLATCAHPPVKIPICP